MKTPPDETTLTLWMDGELQGEELQQMEQWAADHPELLAERDAVRQLNADIRSNVPAEVEPPYPDFFNSRIMRAIEEDAIASTPAEAAATPAKQSSFLRWLGIPAAAAAMLLCFYVGTRVGSPIESQGGQLANNSANVYTPDGNVHADIFTSEDASATVIVLEGLNDIPDDLDIAAYIDLDKKDKVLVTTEEDVLY